MDKLITYLAEYTDIDEGEIKGTSELVIDLGLTSYDIVEILCDIEELYDVEDCRWYVFWDNETENCII